MDGDICKHHFLPGGAFLAYTRLLQVKTQTCLGWHRSLPKRVKKHFQHLRLASLGWFLSRFSFSPSCFAPIQLALSCCLGCVMLSDEFLSELWRPTLLFGLLIEDVWGCGCEPPSCAVCEPKLCGFDP